MYMYVYEYINLQKLKVINSTKNFSKILIAKLS